MLKNNLSTRALRKFSTFSTKQAPVITYSRMVKLKNDSLHSFVSVSGVMHSLKELLANDLATLDDFKKFCHDRNHTMWPSSVDKLKQMRLLNCPVARDVVLSAVSGSKLSLAVSDPIVEPLKNGYKR